MLSVRPITRQERGCFLQYLLPQIVPAVLAPDAPYTLLGALSGTLACGAAAVRWDEENAVIDSLFIDPLVRGKGLGGALTDLAMQLARDRQMRSISCGFVLDGSDLIAAKALFTRRGGTLSYDGPAYCIDSSVFTEKHFIGAALCSRYTPPPAAVPFSQLTAEQLAQLAERTDIPDYLRWETCCGKCDLELSLAWVQEEQITAYILGGQSADGAFLLAAAWRSADAPAIRFPALLRAQLNRCWFRSGGSFLYYFSAVTPPAQKLVKTILQGEKCREYAQMSVKIPL